MRVSVLFFSFCCACFLGLMTPATAQDVRRMMSQPEQQNWLAVGRLNVMGQGYCTGTLVAPDLVLTAAHCLVDRRTGAAIRPERLHFLPGFRAGEYAAHGLGAEVAVLPGFSRAGLTVATDIALVRLTAPVDSSVVPIPISYDLIRSAPLTTLSYGINRSQILSIEDNCTAEHLRGTLVYTDCEGVPGVSGAPVLQMTDQGPRLVAVASAILGGSPQPSPKGKLLAVAIQPLAVRGLSDQLGLTIVIAGLMPSDVTRK